ECRGLVVHELADRRRALADRGTVDVDLLLHVLGRHADREGAQAEAELTDLRVAVVARCRTPDRGVWLLQRLRLDAPGPPRPVLAVADRITLVRPAADDVLDRLAPHLARALRVDAEALELDARCRASGTEVHAAVAQQIEHRDRFGRAYGMVVRLRHEANAV